MSEMPRELFVNDPIQTAAGDLLYEGYASRFHARYKYHHDDKVQGLVDALKPFAAAFNKAEKVIEKDADHDLCHIVRATTFWLSYDDFLKAVSALTEWRKENV